MHIRWYGKEDQKYVVDLMTGHPLQFPDFVIDLYPPRWSYFLQSNDDKHSAFYVATMNDDKIVGHAGYIYNAEAGLYEIVGVVVSNKHQRLGIGKALIDHICNKLADLDAQQIILYTLGHTGNEATLAFYRSIGFDMANFEQDYFQADYHRVTFIKSIG